MRLGFVVKPLGRPELRSHDSRRWQNSPHLSVSLAYLRDLFAYLAVADLRMYRMSSSLAPYATHPDLVAFADQLDACRNELKQCGQSAAEAGLRLSIHAGQFTVANAPDDRTLARAVADLRLQACILDSMELGAEAVVVTHIGGVFGDARAARERFARNFLTLPENVRARLVLENDDSRFSVSDIVWVHGQTGVRLVFDYLHHRLNNPAGLSVREALSLCLATWPAAQTPKVHFSSPRTEWLVESDVAGAAPRLRRTRWSRHSDYINPFEFIDFMAVADGLRPFDVMLEARARDLAVIRLREDLVQYAPVASPPYYMEDLRREFSARY
jgi:UV DNA damage endonuclease